MAEDGAPRLGTYVGKQRDYSCPGDHASWEIALLPDGICTIGCSSELSLSKGGLQAWRVEGRWQWDADEEEVSVDITKDDPLGGPKRERELALPVAEGGALVFKFAGREIPCAWEKPPPDPLQEQLDKLTLKELKGVAIASGLDPAGCVEREDFFRILARARANGSTLNLKPPAGDDDGAGAKAKSSPGSSPRASPGASAGASPDTSPSASEQAPKTGGARGAATFAPAAPAPVAEAAPAVEEVLEEGCYTLEQLTDKRTWEKLDIKATERETYLSTGVFMRLFGMPKDEFAKLPKWKKDNLKKSHDLF